MSHLTVIQTVLRDISAVERACTLLGWQMQQGGRVRYYRGEDQECDWTIMMTGETAIGGYDLSHKYNLGIVRQDDGTLSVLCDNSMCGPVLPSNQTGGETPRILGKLTQHYNYAVLEAEAALAGYELQSTVLDDGTISLRIGVA